MMLFFEFHYKDIKNKACKNDQETITGINTTILIIIDYTTTYNLTSSSKKESTTLLPRRARSTLLGQEKQSTDNAKNVTITNVIFILLIEENKTYLKMKKCERCNIENNQLIWFQTYCGP